MSLGAREPLLAGLCSLTTDCAVCGHPRYGREHHGYSAMDMHHAAVPGPRPQGFGSVTWWYDAGYQSMVVDYISPAKAREPVRLWHHETPERREAITPEDADASREKRL